MVLQICFRDALLATLFASIIVCEQLVIVVNSTYLTTVFRPCGDSQSLLSLAISFPRPEIMGYYTHSIRIQSIQRRPDPAN